MIAVIKNIRMFVVTFIHRGGQTRQTSAGIFYAFADHIYVYGFVPPCGALMRPLPLWWKSTGKAEPFFYFRLSRINFPKMTLTTEKTCSGVKYSTLVSTDDARQAFQERFPLVGKLKVKHRKYYYFAHAVYGERKLFCHAYKSWDALLVRFTAEYADKVLSVDVP